MEASTPAERVVSPLSRTPPTHYETTTSWRNQWAQQVEEERVTWYIWVLGCGGTLLVLLAILSFLHRKGLLFKERMRRPSHAQPWRHWGNPRSRLNSMFDLLNATPREKSPAPGRAEHQSAEHIASVSAAELGAGRWLQPHPFTISGNGAAPGTQPSGPPLQILQPPAVGRSAYS